MRGYALPDSIAWHGMAWHVLGVSQLAWAGLGWMGRVGIQHAYLLQVGKYWTGWLAIIAGWSTGNSSSKLALFPYGTQEIRHS